MGEPSFGKIAHANIYAWIHVLRVYPNLVYNGFDNSLLHTCILPKPTKFCFSWQNRMGVPFCEQNYLPQRSPNKCSEIGPIHWLDYALLRVVLNSQRLRRLTGKGKIY
jgi:hypothetical protein